MLCRACKKDFEIDNFYKQACGRSDYETICKKCKFQQKRKNYRAKPEHYREYARTWREKNNGSEYSHNYYLKNKERIILRTKSDPEHQEKKNIRWHRRRARLLGNGGTHTLAEWKDLKAAYDNRCAMCKKICKLTKDHILPIFRGGADTIDNIQPLCQSCNSRKGRNLVPLPPKP